jgi:hypothetical protein
MSYNPASFCSVYSDPSYPYLSQAKTEFDKSQMQLYCNFASSRDLGPLADYPANYKVPAPKNFLPNRLNTLGDAYLFSGAKLGPTPEDRNYRNQ